MVVLYTAAIFLSALLLFLIQPMVAKLLVPVLGGVPAVWNTAMCFYQVALLAGYLYAHALRHWLTPRSQLIAHSSLFAVTLLWLPIAVDLGSADGAKTAPASWLLGVLLVSIGLPFVALAANGPTLQAWFSQSAHPRRQDPYFLYAASNLGSMTALLGYPFLVEPFFGLASQRIVWSVLYAVFFMLLVACAVALLRSTVEGRATSNADAPTGSPITTRRRLVWLGLAFLPSSLLLGTTTYITSDLAAVPLLWVLPLAIYLLSLVLVFKQSPWLVRESQVLLVPLVVLLSVSLLFSEFRTGVGFLLIPLLALFSASMVCHGRLAEDRPAPSQLTEFYLWLAAGGALGGIFNALIAPTLFDSVWEYPLALVVICMLRNRDADAVDSLAARVRDIVFPVAVMVLLSLFVLSVDSFGKFYTAIFRALSLPASSVLVWVIYLAPVVACAFFWRRPVRFALMLGGVLFIGIAQPFQSEVEVLERERNFFGPMQVTEKKRAGLREMFHGTTLHGLQSLNPKERLTATSYYHATGPLGQLFSLLPPEYENAQIASVGLGAGTMACLAGKEQHITFYEINPAVVAAARNPELFTFLRDCPPKIDVVLGDARMMLRHEPDARFQLLVMDAFSSDSVPVHLLTAEALAEYRAKLRPDGLMAFHVSSWHLDFSPVLAALARDAGLVGRYRVDPGDAADPLKRRSQWVVLASDARVLDALGRTYDGWEPLPPAEARHLWTDDYSNIFSIVR